MQGSALISWESVYGVSLILDIRSGPSGEDFSGTGFFNPCAGAITTRGCLIAGGPTCLHVTGNKAIVGYYGGAYVSDPWGINHRGRGFLEVIDNGPPAAVPQDTVRISYQPVEWPIGQPAPPEDAPFTTCPADLPPSTGSFFWALTGPIQPAPPANDGTFGSWSGSPQDFTVIDAQPQPTTKEGCTDGRWQQYGFRNQGQCIKYVNRGGTT